MAFTYNLANDTGKVRLLLNDIDEDSAVFSDDEIDAFLAIEGASIKRAAAQAIDSQATNEALASKVLRDADGKSTDGAKLADSMRKHAAALRAQAAAEFQESDEGTYFEIVSPVLGCRPPELTEWPHC